MKETALGNMMHVHLGGMPDGLPRLSSNSELAGRVFRARKGPRGALGRRTRDSLARKSAFDLYVQPVPAATAEHSHCRMLFGSSSGSQS